MQVKHINRPRSEFGEAWTECSFCVRGTLLTECFGAVAGEQAGAGGVAVDAGEE